MPPSNFQPIRLLDPGWWYKFKYWMANSTDPDQLASSEANWSGSTLFAKSGHIRGSAGQGLIWFNSRQSKLHNPIFASFQGIYSKHPVLLQKTNNTTFKQNSQLQQTAFFFSEKMSLDISCELSAKQQPTSYMPLQLLRTEFVSM